MCRVVHPNQTMALSQQGPATQALASVVSTMILPKPQQKNFTVSLSCAELLVELANEEPFPEIAWEEDNSGDETDIPNSDSLHEALSLTKHLGASGGLVRSRAIYNGLNSLEIRDHLSSPLACSF